MTEKNRKKPMQQRSVRSVEYIAEAVIQVLDVEEQPKFTTNHIAERAGVSIGTLYRYFPDKGILLRFVAMREVKRTSEAILKVIESSNARESESLLLEVVDASMTAFGQRSRATQRIRELAQSDKALLEQMDRTRLRIARKLHDRMLDLEPRRFDPISDTELATVCEVYKTAIFKLGGGMGGRAIPAETCARLFMATLSAFSRRDLEA